MGRRLIRWSCGFGAGAWNIHYWSAEDVFADAEIHGDDFESQWNYAHQPLDPVPAWCRCRRG
jgi:hypothetical protein